MRQRRDERVEHYDCPKDVIEALKIAGGLNPFGEPMFRVVWGYNRIVKMTGEWQEFEQFQVPDIPARMSGNWGAMRTLTRLKRSVVETREVPKYLPANCWHLEMWRPAEEYGSPENWRKMGEEVMQGLTVDAAGEYPSRGEYELCYPLTHDGTCNGVALPLEPEVVLELVRMIKYGREKFSFQQRRAAIEQRELKKEEGFVKRTRDILKDALPPFAGEEFIVKP